MAGSLAGKGHGELALLGSTQELDLSRGKELEVRGGSRSRCSRHENEWHVLYTRRTDRVESHKGQVSFPGGACDEGRLPPNRLPSGRPRRRSVLTPLTLKILGPMANLITITYFRVTPVVGVIKWPAVS